MLTAVEWRGSPGTERCYAQQRHTTVGVLKFLDDP